MKNKRRYFEGLVVFIFIIVIIFSQIIVNKIKSANEVEVESVEKSLYFNIGNPIVIYSREDGSGIRDEFIKYFEINEKSMNDIFDNVFNKKSFMETDSSSIVQGISKNQYAIGYTTLSNVEGYVDTITMDGIAPTLENVNNNKYPMTVSYHIAYNYVPTGLTKDFLNYLSTKDAYKIISRKYVAEDYIYENFENEVVGGTLKINGSSSMEPLILELIDGYKKYNPYAQIDVSISNSESALSALNNGKCDLAMTSRDIDNNEGQISSKKIATDAIVIIKNRSNSLVNLNSSEVNSIYTGSILTWRELLGD